MRRALVVLAVLVAVLSARARAQEDACAGIPDTLAQGWDCETRQRFWFRSQGSQLIPYVWFLHLEQAGSEELYRSDAHMDALRYLPVPAGRWNPDGLPIGFARDARTEWVGFTCAACHTGRIEHAGASWIVEGGPAMADFGRALQELVAALHATAEDDTKFDRFATKLHGSPPGPAERARLRAGLRSRTAELAQRLEINSLPAGYPAGHPGFARTDAFGQIFNLVSAVGLGDATNRNDPDAPVSYPALWGAPYADKVQWNGSAPNTMVIGHLLRNVGEVIGVFATLELSRPPWWKFWRKGYESSVDFAGLGELEEALWDLRAPRCPTALPSAHPQVAAGRSVYEARCIGCHELIPEETPFDVRLKDVQAIGTDPNMASNGVSRRCRSLDLEGARRLVVPLPGQSRLASEELCQDLVIHAAAGAVVRHLDEAIVAAFVGWKASGGLDALADDDEASEEQLLGQLRAFVTARQQDPGTPPQYRARPLHGVWATAPYLHNGSVPSLWELLKPPAERASTFCVGSREFDATNVGFATQCGPGTSELDTRIPGNSNQGHDKASGLSEAARRALIEFLKTL